MPSLGQQQTINGNASVWNGREWVVDYGQKGVGGQNELWGLSSASSVSGPGGSVSTSPTAGNVSFGGGNWKYDPSTASWRRIQAPAAAPAAPTGPTPQQTQALQGTTNRTLELLRQQVGQGMRQGTGHLRQNLAQRGMLDSGSLGAGITSMSNAAGNTLASGTMMAANKESDSLMSLLEAERSRQFASQMQTEQLNAQRQLAQMQITAQQDMQPQWWEYLLGGVGQGLGTAGGYALGSRLMPSGAPT